MAASDAKHSPQSKHSRLLGSPVSCGGAAFKEGTAPPHQKGRVHGKVCESGFSPVEPSQFRSSKTIVFDTLVRGMCFEVVDNFCYKNVFVVSKFDLK